MILTKLCSLIDKFIESFTSLLMLGLIVDVTWQVITRFFTNNPSSFTEELARYLLIWIAFLGAAHAFRKGAHLGLDYFIDKLSLKNQRLVSRFILCVVSIFSVLILIVGGCSLAYLSWELDQISASLGISISLVYLSIPISGVVFVLFSAELLTKNLNKK